MHVKIDLVHCIFKNLAVWLLTKFSQRCLVGFFEVRDAKYLNAKIPSYCYSCYCDVWRENGDYLGWRGFKNPFQEMMTEEE